MIDIAKHRELEAKATTAKSWLSGVVVEPGNMKEAQARINEDLAYVDMLRNDHAAMLDELEAARAFVESLEQHLDSTRTRFDQLYEQALDHREPINHVVLERFLDDIDAMLCVILTAVTKGER